MISIVIDHDAISFVVNDDQSRTARLVSVIIQAVLELRKERHFAPERRALERWGKTTVRQWKALPAPSNPRVA